MRIMPEELSDEAKELLIQFQGYQQQMQNVLIQKENFKLQSMEVDRALEELGATKQASAFKVVGSIMINKPVEELKKELGESKEDLGIRLKSMDAVELKLKEKLKDIQARLKGMMKG